MSPVVVWFRQDLRLRDNPALSAAAKPAVGRRNGGEVIPVYIWAPHEEGDWPPGAASRWWLHHSLEALDRELRAKGSRLIVRSGDTITALWEVIEQTGADRVMWNRRYEPAARQRDSHVQTELSRRGVSVEVFNGSLLFDVTDIRNRSGRPFQVFTPFWQTCLELDEPAAPVPAPRSLLAPRRWPSSVTINALQLLPKTNWAGGIAEGWTPGERAAGGRLRRFVRTGLARYADDRDRPDLPGTSCLSPHLHWGEISPRQVWQAGQNALNKSPRRSAGQGASAFLRELGWREFTHHVLWHWPQMPEQPLRGTFADLPWERNEANLRAWQQGRTGYPFVDAGMRQLWQTGWMHNRVRMIVGSFLVKHLLISWEVGSRWFWDTLVDADLANNAFNWQWVAGCGADAAPYFRVFNPVSQGHKSDPQGRYVLRFLPELKGRSPGVIHRPLPAEEPGLGLTGLAPNYPAPIVDHPSARQRFLDVARVYRV